MDNPIDASIFRTYDIRGVVDETLTESGVEKIGQAIASELIVAGETQVVLGRDGRLSAPRFADAMARGLTQMGISVIDLGQVMTPMCYFAAETLDGVHSCVMLTGSHNPSNYNGIKIVIQGVTLFGDAIQALKQRIDQECFEKLPRPGQILPVSITAAYQTRILEDIQLVKPLKVVVDAGNGVAGAFAPALLRQLGCEVVELFCEVDGHFPNHHPDPAKLKNLETLSQTVLLTHADCGIAFDGDGDRCGVVDNEGHPLYPDRQLMLYAQDVLTRVPGALVLYDIKCSALLAKVVEAAGGQAMMWKTGHSYMKAKMRETGAALGGEVSGHMFFKERWYGFDDGLYTAARMLEILAKAPSNAATLFAQLPNGYNTPEIEIEMAEGEPYVFMDKIRQTAQFDHATVFDLDGLRVDFKDGWGLIRASNTTPVIVLRFEGETPEALQRIQQQFKTLIHRVDPKLVIPF